MSYVSLIWAGLFRRRTRTVLTLISITVAFLLFGLLRSIADAFTVGVDIAGVDRLIVQPKYSIIDPLPIRHLSEIVQVPGVAMATHADWFGGFYQERKNFFPKYPVDAKEWFAVYPELRIDPAQLEAFENTRTAAVVPAEMAAKYGWKVGDRIPIEADIYPKKDNSRRGNSISSEPTWPRRAEIRRTLSCSTTTSSTKRASSARAKSAGSWCAWPIHRRPPKSRARSTRVSRTRPTRRVRQPRPSLRGSSPTRSATSAPTLGGILGAVFFTIVLLTGNTMAQAFRERVPELAVLKTLGFSDSVVSMIVLGEAVFLCAVGGGLGLGIAALLAPGVARGIKDILPGFEIVWQTIAIGLAIAVLLGLVVGAVPAITARRLRIVDALRER